MWSQIDLRQIAISSQRDTPGKRVNFDDANYRIWVALNVGYFGERGRKCGEMCVVVGKKLLTSQSIASERCCNR